MVKLRVGEGRGILWALQCLRCEREECESEHADLAKGSSLSLSFSIFASPAGARAIHDADGRANS